MCKCTDAALLTNTHLTFANYRGVIMSCHANEEYYEQRYQDLIEQYESEEEQQRRDEKNGLYPDREDIAN